MTSQEEMLEHDKQLQQEESEPRFHSKSPTTESNPKSSSDSLPVEPFMRADRTFCRAPQLIHIQHDGLCNKRLRELRQLAYVYTELGPRRNFSHADTNPTGIAYMTATDIPLTITLLAQGDDGEYIHVPVNDEAVMGFPSTGQSGRKRRT